MPLTPRQWLAERLAQFHHDLSNPTGNAAYALLEYARAMAMLLPDDVIADVFSGDMDVETLRPYLLQHDHDLDTPRQLPLPIFDFDLDHDLDPLGGSPHSP